MKKLISAILAATMALPFGTAFADESYTDYADAAGMADILEPTLVAPLGPTLIYNNAEIGEEGSMPFIENDRTMLPFRYLLEEIGATVEYDEPTRTVNAAKEDISIAFSLDDTYIDVTKNGETERIVQDTANVIRDDRVYVPIRFMSEAFELNVGWDSYNQTAIIIDIPAYIDALEESAPEFVQYMEIVGELPESYTQTLDMTMDFKAQTETESMDFGFALDSELSLNGGAVSADAVIDIVSSIFEAESINAEGLKDISFNFMYNDGQFYLKTNLIEKLQALIPDNEDLNSVAVFVNENIWFKADIYELFELLGLPEELISVVKSSLGGSMSTDDLGEMIETMYASEITSIYDAILIDEVFSIYNMMFGELITITDKGDNNYEIDLSLTAEDIAGMINSMELGEEMTAEELGIVFDMTGKIIVENGIETSTDMTFSMGVDEGNVLTFTVNSILAPDTNKEITVPDSALNLIDIIGLIM